MSTINVTIDLEVTDQHCADILCTALEAGYQGMGSWCQADKIKMSTPVPPTEGGDNYVSCVVAELNDDESDYDWSKPLTVDYSVIRTGIQRLLSNPKYSRLATGIMQDIITDSMGCFIDAGVADVIVQFGLFNEERYA